MELTYNMSIIIQVIYPKDLRKHAEKNKHISALIFATALFTLAKKKEGIQVSIERQFHKQTVVYTQWNMIQPLKVGTSDNVDEPYSHYVK